MKIEIIQKEFTFFQDKYDIIVDEVLTFRAKSIVFSFLSKIRILDLNNIEIGRVEKDFNFPKVNFPRYDLVFGDNSQIRLMTDSFTHYKLHISKGIVDIYEQKGRKLGLFLNDNQVGVIDKNKNVHFGGDKYQILLDSDELEKELVIAFTLAYDNFFHNNRNTMINIDFGNVIIETEKIIDPNWRPKKLTFANRP
jgi:hypothetical protein